MTFFSSSGLRNACRVPAGVAVAAYIPSSLMIREKGPVNASRKFVTQTANSVASKAVYANNVTGFSSSARIGANSGGLVVTKLPYSTKAPTESKSLIQLYEHHLQSSPVKTKMITGGILWGLGDVAAQVVPPMFFEDKSDEKNSNASAYDFQRTGRAVFFGFAIHAPLAHVHYNFLETLTVRTGITGLSIPVFKAFMEQFVYWSWLSNSIYHGAMSLMQGQNLNQAYDRIADVLWETQKSQWVFWIPVQLVNFRFVPVRHQLNVVLVTSIVWTALLSAWYPPTDEKEKTKKALEEN